MCIVCQRVCVSPTEMALYYNVYSFSVSSVFLVFVLVSYFTERESQFQQRRDKKSETKSTPDSVQIAATGVVESFINICSDLFTGAHYPC